MSARAPGVASGTLAFLLLAHYACTQSTPAASASQAAAPASAQAGQSQIQQPPPTGGSLAERLKAVQSGEADKPKAPLPNWKPYTSGTSAPTIPVVTGLVVVTAISLPLSSRCVVP